MQYNTPFTTLHKSFYIVFSARLRAFKFNPKQYKQNINTFQTLQKCYEFITVLQLSFIKLNKNQKRELLNVSFRAFT